MTASRRYLAPATTLTTVAFVSTSALLIRHIPKLFVRSHSSSTLITMSKFGGGQGVVVPARPTAGKRANATLIFLHGLGDTGAGWSSAFPLPDLEYLKVVLPTADSIPVSLNMGMRMPSFFDLHGLEIGDPVDETGIQKAIARVERIVEEEVVAGVKKERIVVAGFSQGGALALRYGLQATGVKGIVGLSSWLPGGKEAAKSAKGNPKILMCHGVEDPLVKCEYGKMSAELLREHGHDVKFRTFSGLAHSANPQELNVFAQFLKSLLEN